MIPKLFEQDIPKNLLSSITDTRVVAWDTEMSGLDWSKDRIAMCQLHSPTVGVVIVRIREELPKNLIAILTNTEVKKIFHFAVGDLRFYYHHWNVLAENVACTKIASKILNPHKTANHSLKPLLKKHLSITIDKEEQLSNWFAEVLTEKQLIYAANDVLHLISLLETLERKLKRKKLLRLAQRAFDHIPTRVELDVRKYLDIYPYDALKQQQ